MNIGIVIFSNHQNGLINLVRLLSSMTDKIIIFTSSNYKQKVSEGLDSNAIKWVEQSSEKPRQEFLSNKVTQMCNQSVDILFSFPFYTGIKTAPHRAFFSPKCLYVQIIYNANLWTMNRVRWEIKLYKYFNPVLRRLLIRKFDAILVEFSPIKQYLSGRTNTDVYSFTPLMYDNKRVYERQNKNSRFLITIPGNVTSKRRDYETILRTIRNQLQLRKSELIIELLGNPSDESGEKILQQCTNLKQDGWSIITHEDWISTEEFDRRIQAADVILAPMRRTKDISVVTERYGISKGSGCFMDAVMHGKPLILPAHYEVPARFEPMVSQYDTESGLAAIIEQMMNSPQKQEIAQKHAADTFNIMNQRERLREILSKIVE